MNRSALLAIAAVVALAGAVACSSDSTFDCAGDCTAPDGGSTSLDQLITAGSQGDATTQCFSDMSTALSFTCNSSNSICACAQQ